MQFPWVRMVEDPKHEAQWFTKLKETLMEKAVDTWR